MDSRSGWIQEPTELSDVLNVVDERKLGLSVMCLGLEQLGVWGRHS